MSKLMEVSGLTMRFGGLLIGLMMWRPREQGLLTNTTRPKMGLSDE